MLAVSVDLLHGTIRAGSADGLAGSGLDDRGEWPPSPARLLSAFVAADGTGDRCRITTGAELRHLETAPPPLIHADALVSVAASPSVLRYVVNNATTSGTVQNYPGRSSAEVRGSRRSAPKHARLVYSWPELNLGDDTVEALRRRAARIGYLGCADSPARVGVHTTPPATDGLATWRPVPASSRGAVSLPVAYDGFIEGLDRAFEQFCTGVPVQRSWVPTQRHWYHDGEVQATPPIVWARLTQVQSGRRVVALTSALRRAVMSRWAEASSGPGMPPEISGHGQDGAGYEHARWLALPDVGHIHASGRIHALAVWLPPATDPAVAEALSRAVALVADFGLRVAWSPTPLSLSVSSGEEGPEAARRGRWETPSRVFTTAFPAVHERWTGAKDLSVAEVAQWCAHAGLPEPVAIQATDQPLLTGGVELRSHEVHRRQDRHPYSHVRICFQQEISGLHAVGRGRHFGLGLLAPEPFFRRLRTAASNADRQVQR